MKTISLSVAGFIIRIVAPEGFALLQSYTPFFVSGCDSDEPLFVLTIAEGPAPVLDGLEPMATGNNDLGEARLYRLGSDYALALSLFPGSGIHVMTMSPDFRSARMYASPGDPYLSLAADSMLHILFAQAAVARGCFILHASLVEAGGKAVLFMGRSGTGKSTHAALWCRTFADTTLLNDDNPAVRVLPDGSVRAYGTPWSGKTPCYRQASAPVSAFVRLRQAPANAFRTLSDVEAFVAILPGVSAIIGDTALYSDVCSLVAEASQSVVVGFLDCLPDEDAARMCRQNCLGALE